MDGFFRNTCENGMAAGQMLDTPEKVNAKIRVDSPKIGLGPPAASPLEGLELQTVQLHDMIKNLHRAIDDLSGLLTPLVAQSPVVPTNEIDECLHPSNSALGNVLLEATKEVRDASRRIDKIRRTLDL